MLAHLDEVAHAAAPTRLEPDGPQVRHCGGEDPRVRARGDARRTQPGAVRSPRDEPRLRARHLPFTISSRERDEWLWCMDRALDEHEMPDVLRDDLRQKLHALADHMRNAPDT